MRFLFNNYKLVQRLIHIISAIVFIASCLFVIWLYQHGYLTNQAKLQTKFLPSMMRLSSTSDRLTSITLCRWVFYAKQRNNIPVL